MTELPARETTREELIAEICRLNFELGKRDGELLGLRSRWIVSNHEAWEQGRDAPRHATNPFPKP